jgi:hypothetical protein
MCRGATGGGGGGWGADDRIALTAVCPCVMATTFSGWQASKRKAVSPARTPTSRKPSFRAPPRDDDEEEVPDSGETEPGRVLPTQGRARAGSAAGAVHRAEWQAAPNSVGHCHEPHSVPHDTLGLFKDMFTTSISAFATIAQAVRTTVPPVPAVPPPPPSPVSSYSAPFSVTPHAAAVPSLPLMPGGAQASQQLPMQLDKHKDGSYCGGRTCHNTDHSA